MRLANNRILIIDDNPAIHDDIRKILTIEESQAEFDQTTAMLFGDVPDLQPRASFHIDSAYQGQEGLEMIKKAALEGSPYAVAFVDIRMPPGWDGIETIARIWQHYPELQIIICTAFSDYSWEEMIQKLGHSPSLVVLKKPFDNVEVLQLAHALAEKWSLTRQVRSQLETLDILVRKRTSELEAANEQLKKEISARIEAEGVLRLSEERFSKAFRATPIPLAIQCLATDTFVDVNASFVAMLHGEREQVLNRTAADLKLWPDSQAVAAIFQDLRNQASVRNRPCQIQTLTGELRDTLISVEPFDLGSGPHLLLIAQDITEQLKLETQLRQSQKMEAVGQLAAGVAHDFNNILTAINGHTSLLQQQLGGDAFQTRSLTVISLAAERAARLVRQLLTFSRKQVFKPQPIHLNQVAMNLQDMLLRTLGDHIELKVKSVANLPTIKADVSMMEQVILNLCVNARDAMPRGGKVIMELSTVEMAIEVARQRGLSRQGQYVHLAVIDSGCGISTEHLPRIFDPFFTTKDVGKGTGLGLATVYGIIQQHRGCIEVESIVDVGTTFHVYLPASDEAAIQTVSQEAPIHKNDAGSACILIVEDEDMVRSIATATLRRKGYRMLEASSGVEALKLFRDHIEHIDLLFTDVMMPGNMLGDELANQVRELRPTIPILFTSGYSPDVAQLQLLSNSSFLPKPFTTAQLLQSIQRCLDRARNGGSDTTFFKSS